MSDLALVLSDGVTALREGDTARAVELLGVVAEDAALAEASDLRDVRLRVLTLYAQALLDAGQASRARHPLQHARDLATTLGDPEASTAIAELEERIGTALSERFAAQARSRTLRALAERDIDDLLAEAPDDRHLAVLVERASAALEVDRPDEARRLAERTLHGATARDDLRHQVLALLVLARATPGQASAHLEEARRRCDDADAFDLLAFVVQAADQAGVRLTTRGVHAEDPGWLSRGLT